MLTIENESRISLIIKSFHNITWKRKTTHTAIMDIRTRQELFIDFIFWQFVKFKSRL